jgi:D-amino-acid dehydrogenase
MKPTVIIGGGIIGLFSAYYLVREGIEVEIIDQTDLQNTCSTGNAGMIVPSHIIPLASPGMIEKGIKWMFSRKSPFYIHPRLDKRLIEWGWLFYKHANARHVAHSIPNLKNIGLLSRALYVQFAGEHKEQADIGLETGGLLMLYQSKHIEKEEIEGAMLARKHGLEAEIISKADLSILEPNQEINAIGGVFYPGDAHLRPEQLQVFLRQYLLDKGVKFHLNETVQVFDKQSDKINAIITDKATHQADNVVFCAGSWSGLLGEKLGIKLPMMGGKGYSFFQSNRPKIAKAAILVDARVSVSPYDDQVRFGGTMEITGINTKIDPMRVQGIVDSINRYYPAFETHPPAVSTIWTGLRPCSPDGLPYIGRVEGFSNLIIGTGHSMMGLSLAPATGKIMAEILQNQETSIPLAAFSPLRFHKN